MKRLLISTAAFLALSSAAFAQTSEMVAANADPATAPAEAAAPAVEAPAGRGRARRSWRMPRSPDPNVYQVLRAGDREMSCDQLSAEANALNAQLLADQKAAAKRRAAPAPAARWAARSPAAPCAPSAASASTGSRARWDRSASSPPTPPTTPFRRRRPRPSRRRRGQVRPVRHARAAADEPPSRPLQRKELLRSTPPRLVSPPGRGGTHFLPEILSLNPGVAACPRSPRSTPSSKPSARRASVSDVAAGEAAADANPWPLSAGPLEQLPNAPRTLDRARHDRARPVPRDDRLGRRLPGGRGTGRGTTARPRSWPRSSTPTATRSAA